MSKTTPMTKQWTLHTDEPVFAGHFPGRPLLPGGMLLDWAVSAFAQAQGRSSTTFAVRQARFLAPACPGMTLAIEAGSDRRGRPRLRVTSVGEGECLLDLLLETPAPALKKASA
ncbi:hypothetical protein [Guyparkeria sp.]|uniref:hypothetical protein n=1 Tax=Guyparkeria sp. TaxID=2035736 RepID=UPI0039704705